MTIPLDNAAKLSESGPPIEMTWPWFPIVHSEYDTSSAVGNTELVWQSKDESLSVGDFEIKSPLTYVSVDAPSVDEASCINTALEVDADWKGEDTNFGFWPRYSEFSPAQRAEYLAWLADERKTKPENLGYLFLYFFGLERRILIDDVEPEPILRELLQLLKRFGKLEIFYNVASHFVAFVFATVKIERIRENWFQRLFLNPTHKLHEDELIVALTWLHQHDKSLPGELAYQIAMRDVRCLSKPSIEETEKQLRSLFISKYNDAIPEGIPLEKSDLKHTFSYRPLNPTLQGWRTSESLHAVTLPDILGIAGQFQPLVELWYECLAELELIPHEDSKIWRSILDENMDSRGRVFTTIETIIKNLDIKAEYGASLSMSQSLALIERARSIHLSIEPNPLTLFRPYRHKDRVAIVLIDNPDEIESEHYFLSAQLLLELGFGMALADGEIDRAELLHLPAIVNAQFHFSEDDRRRILAFCDLRRQHPPKLTTITRRLSRELKQDLRADLGRFLVGVAASNNIIEDCEDHCLVKLFQELDLSSELLETSYSTLFPQAKNQTVTGQSISDSALNKYLSNIIQISLKLAELYRVILKNRSKKPRRKRAKRGVPKAGSSTLAIEHEYTLEHQFTHYDVDNPSYSQMMDISSLSE